MSVYFDVSSSSRNQYQRRNPWRSRGWLNGKRIHIGWFPTREEAKEAEIAWFERRNARHE